MERRLRNSSIKDKQVHYLKTEFDGVQINGVWTVDVTEALSEWIDSDLLSLLESVCDVSPPDTLDTEVGELHRHLLIVDVHRADSFLTAVSAHTCGGNQIVWVSLGHLGVVSDATDHHHCGSLVADYLDLGERLLVRTGPLPLQGARPAPLALIPEPQGVGLGLLQNLEVRFLYRLEVDVHPCSHGL